MRGELVIRRWNPCRNNVTYESARSDLLGLESMHLFEKQRIGKKYVFRARPELRNRLAQLGD